MDSPWVGYAPDDPHSNPGNWASYDKGNTWEYIGPGSAVYAPLPETAPSYNYDAAEPYGMSENSVITPAGPNTLAPQSAYLVGYDAAPTYSGTPGTGSGIANPYDPSQVAAGEQAAYETLLANGAIPLVGGETAPAAAPVAPAPGAPSTAIAPGNPAPADPYGLTATADPFTGQATYDASYSTGGGGSTNLGGGGEWGMPGMPSFGGQATNPGRQQPVIPGQFDPFAWSGNPNPMGMMAPNEMREMVLGAMQLGAEIQQQQTEPPRMDARQYALHRLGLMEPEEQAPPVPFLPPRAPFGG